MAASLPRSDDRALRSASSFVKAGFVWKTYDNVNVPSSREEDPTSTTWERPKCLVNGTRRLPPVFRPEENAGREEESNEPTSFGLPGTSSRNQQEDAEQPLARCSPIQTPLTEGFFKPWKHTREPNDDDEDDDPSPRGQNKWKSRAIMNPFAKKRDKRGGTLPAANNEDTLVPQPPPQPIGLHNLSRRQKFHVSITKHKQHDQVDAPEEHQQQQQHATDDSPEEPQQDSSPITESKSPDASVPLSSRHLRRLKGFEQASASSSSSDSSGNNGKENDKILDEPKMLPPHNSPQRNLNSKRLLDPLPVARKTNLNLSTETDNIDIATSKRPTTLKPLRPPVGLKPKCKLSAMQVLADIKRKRDERRVLHQQAKQRIRDEIEEHGDDNGFKFQRLIQQYRDSVALASSSSAKVTLPPLQHREVSYNAVNRLSVFIRKRPLAKKELKAKGYDVITCLADGRRRSTALNVNKNQLVCHEPKLKVDLSESIENHVFGFDGVFDENEPNESVYAVTVGPLLPSLLQNGNLTVFAYGQTGSGKTYTMKSIYRQVGGDLFKEVNRFQTAKPKQKLEIGVCFYEIYMNNVNDLLNERKRVVLMEDAEGVVQLMGIEEKRIENAEELQELVAQGEHSRATSANAVHDDSSRSHALLRVCVYDAAKHECVAQICMVDLAGSERACDMQSDGKHTRMEGAEINKSLLALKECIRALDRGATHVPFRQSKLTQLLRDSFVKSNSKTVMIATISPCSDNSNHTLNTLRYADRLKEINASVA